MKIIKYDPFKEVERFFEDDFGFFPAVRRHLGPSMDVYETDNDLVVELQVPKIDASKVNVEVEDGVLKIEGGDEQVKENEGKNYYRKEIKSGSFSRMLSLPVSVKEDEAKAVYEHGVLRVTLPKVEQKKAKRVDVEVK